MASSLKNKSEAELDEMLQGCIGDLRRLKKTARRVFCKNKRDEMVELPIETSYAEIKRRYREASKVCHPDRGYDDQDIQVCLNWQNEFRKFYKGNGGEDPGPPPSECGELMYGMWKNGAYRETERDRFAGDWDAMMRRNYDMRNRYEQRRERWRAWW